MSMYMYMYMTIKQFLAKLMNFLMHNKLYPLWGKTKI